MKKIFAIVLALSILFAFCACNKSTENSSDDSTEDTEAEKALTELAGKSPKDLYNSAIEYVKSLTNYEIIIDSTYKTEYEGETSEEVSQTVHRCSGDTFCYSYKSESYEELFLHDGKTLYQTVNNVSEKRDVPYEEFMNGWGSVTSDGMLIILDDTFFEKKFFIPDGDEYYLDITISKDEYYEITQGTVEEPVEYKVYFDSEGVFTRFSRKMCYYYYDVILVEDSITVKLQNVGSAAASTAPENADLFSVRVSAEDIDLSTVDSLDLFEPSSDVTDYVLLDMKVEGSVKLNETETVDGYSGKILIRLFPEVAPLTVDNFKNLVGASFYNGLTMHRIIKDFVVQGGDPKGDGTGGSDNTIFGEFSSNGFTNNLLHKRGVVSMARSDDKDSASSQIFICHADASNLDGNYASFGFVVYGLDTVDIIAGLEVDENDAPKQKVIIEKASFMKAKS